MSANETTQVSSVPTFDCRQTFVETLIELAAADKRIGLDRRTNSSIPT